METSVEKKSGWYLLQGTVVVGVFLIMLFSFFNVAFMETWTSWQQEEYSHGYLIPVIGMMLLLNWKKKEVLGKKKNSWLGLAGVLFCFLVEVLFLLTGINGIQPLLLVCFLLSLFVLFYGHRYAVSLAGPLCFFFFLAPLPKFLYYTLSVKMQMIATTVSVLLLDFSGISVFQDGNVIDLGITQLQVAEACNGLRYLFPLMALGYLLAYMYEASFLKRAVLFFSTVPITILMNSLRIYLIGLSANIWGAEIAEGLVHDVEGWVMFLGCLLVLGGEIALCQMMGKKGEMAFDVISIPTKDSWSMLFPAPIEKPVKAAAVICLFSMVAAFFLLSINAKKIEPVPLEKPLTEFPLQIGNWHGQAGTMDKAALDILGTDDYLIADYINPKGDRANLYILYYPKQDSTSNQAIHTPAVCIPSGGWEIMEQGRKTISLPDGQDFTVNRFLISKGLERHLVYFWFVQAGEPSYDTNFAKFIQIKNALFKKRMDGAMIRLTTKITEKSSEEMAEQKLDKFLSETKTTIFDYIGSE